MGSEQNDITMEDQMRGLIGAIFYIAHVNGISAKKLAEDTGIPEKRILDWFGPKGLTTNGSPDMSELVKLSKILQVKFVPSFKVDEK
jgi:hypothetical protein